MKETYDGVIPSTEFHLNWLSVKLSVPDVQYPASKLKHTNIQAERRISEPQKNIDNKWQLFSG